MAFTLAWLNINMTKYLYVHLERKNESIENWSGHRKQGPEIVPI